MFGSETRSRALSGLRSSKRNESLIIACILTFLTCSAWIIYREPLSSNDWQEGILFDKLEISPLWENNTKVAGGIPGFYVLENLWYHDGDFHAFTSDPDGNPDEGFPDRDKIMSGPHQIIFHPLSDQRQIISEAQGEVRIFDGQTIFLNDGADSSSWSYLNWFYHLAAEALLGGIASLVIVYDSPSSPSLNQQDPHAVLYKSLPRLLIPWESNWKDGYGLNEAMVRGIFGERVVERNVWDQFNAKGEWIGFEKVIIVDRYASHRYNELAIEWNKMSLPIFSELPIPTPPFFAPYRASLLQSLDLATPIKRDGPGKALNSVPRIVYLDRQETSRKMTDEDDSNLRQVLRNLENDERATIGIPHLPSLDFKGQVEAVKDADIIIGVHGNGLTHQLWMPEGGILIELFIPDTFLRDYQVLSQALGHRHIATWDDRILAPSEREGIKGQLNPSILHDGTRIPLNTFFIRTSLEDLLLEMTG